MALAVENLPADAILAHRLAMRRIWRRSLKLLKSIAAVVDLTHFPGSCCG
ncbi:hypothetical protein [Bradyrhizobium sp. ARR65]|nr:hypothetical protein [Bradyrhizobium sp. ARR65]